MALVIDRAYPGRDRKELAGLSAFGWWSRAVPRRVALNARPVRLHEGTLVVHTTTSAWASDLDFARARILVAVQRYAPSAGVTQLRIQVGPLPAFSDVARVRTGLREVQMLSVAELPDDLARALAQVPSDDLRNAISAAARISLAPASPRPARPKPR